MRLTCRLHLSEHRYIFAIWCELNNMSCSVKCRWYQMVNAFIELSSHNKTFSFSSTKKIECDSYDRIFCTQSQYVFIGWIQILPVFSLDFDYTPAPLSFRVHTSLIKSAYELLYFPYKSKPNWRGMHDINKKFRFLNDNVWKWENTI